MEKSLQNLQNPQAGFGAIAYIILAIVLLASLTAALTRGGSDSAISAQVDRAREELYAQANYIVAAIEFCRTGNGGTGTGTFLGYPNPGVQPADVSGLTCPNSNPATLWTGSWFYPKDIPGFAANGWKYIHDDEAVSISIALSDAGNAQFISSVIGVNLKGRFGNNEAVGGLECSDAIDDIACRCSGEEHKFVYYLTRIDATADHCSGGTTY